MPWVSTTIIATTKPMIASSVARFMTKVLARNWGIRTNRWHKIGGLTDLVAISHVEELIARTGDYRGR